MPLTVETVDEFFRRYGWHCEFDADSTTWITGFRGDSGSFNIFVHLTENWLYFVVSPFVDAPENETCEPRLCRYLLRLNHAINLAKFGIDDDGDVVLTVELPTETLDFGQFCDALGAITYYADAHYPDLQRLAEDPDFVPPVHTDDVSEEGDVEEWELAGEPGDESEKPN